MAGIRRFLLTLLCPLLLPLTVPPGVLFAQTAWFLNPLPSGNSYYAVSFPDTANGWCVGEAGIIVRTTDSGASWLFVESGTDTPNPFNPSTVVTYTVARQTRVRLIIYDLMGREVATLVDEVQLAGSHRIRWSPRGLSSGVYFYRLTAGKTSQVRKMIYLQ